MYQYPQPPPVPPQRSNGIHPLIVVLIAAGSMMFGCLSGVAITNQPNRTPVSGSKQVTVTATQVTVTATPSPSPTMDAYARDMCVNTVQAAAYLKAGDKARAQYLQNVAETHARNSAVPAVQQIGAGASADVPAKMTAWCKENLPEVTASPVAKPSPKKTTAKPKPRKTTKKPAPPVEEEPAPIRDVTPGAFCSPTGAIGTHKGRTYTCKGPGQARWRR